MSSSLNPQVWSPELARCLALAGAEAPSSVRADALKDLSLAFGRAAFKKIEMIGICLQSVADVEGKNMK